jgi:hypothetical protein
MGQANEKPPVINAIAPATTLTERIRRCKG